jgi:hypothetical protein
VGGGNVIFKEKYNGESINGKIYIHLKRNLLKTIKKG